MPRLGAPLAGLEPLEREQVRSRYRAKIDPSRNWYGTKVWKDLRKVIADRDDWTCQATGILLTTVPNLPNSLTIDHITPHKGARDLFFDPANCQAVAKSWHDSEKQRQDHAAGHHDQGRGGINP